MLGQHFLINKSKLSDIVEALDLKSGDTVIEIGPGHGELTDELRISARGGSAFGGKNNKLKIIAIEKDEPLFLFLRKKFFGDKDIEIIRGNALKIIPELTENFKPKIKGYKIAGNIPYYITGHLLRILGELKNKPSLIILTVQKEVAERICVLRRAQDKPKMNLLAASVQFWADPEIIGYVSRKDFQPPPEVDSAIIKLSPRIGVDLARTNAENYYRLVKILFKQPRKTILNNLKPMAGDLKSLIEKLELLGVDSNARPQDLSVENIKKLAESLEKNII